jgi:hypothetical protein
MCLTLLTNRLVRKEHMMREASVEDMHNYISQGGSPQYDSVQVVISNSLKMVDGISASSIDHCYTNVPEKIKIVQVV